MIVSAVFTLLIATGQSMPGYSALAVLFSDDERNALVMNGAGNNWGYLFVGRDFPRREYFGVLEGSHWCGVPDSRKLPAASCKASARMIEELVGLGGFSGVRLFPDRCTHSWARPIVAVNRGPGKMLSKAELRTLSGREVMNGIEGYASPTRKLSIITFRGGITGIFISDGDLSTAKPIEHLGTPATDAVLVRGEDAVRGLRKGGVNEEQRAFRTAASLTKGKQIRDVARAANTERAQRSGAPSRRGARSASTSPRRAPNNGLRACTLP